MAPANPGTKTLVLENTSRRDTLVEFEKKYQKQWADNKIFEVDAPENLEDLSPDDLLKKYPKFMSSLAYPYMNGVLHAGHAFTLSKVEFAVGFERMQGKRALFPLGFHCTGLPIKACADKLFREKEMFGENYDNENAPKDDDEEEEVKPQVKAVKEDPSKFSSNKSKANAKQGKGKYQFQIMLQLGIPREQISKFADPYYWVQYFPPLCQEFCTQFGARIDWRRSFVTTDANPYYDSFIRWQMNTLKALGKIKFDKRYTIYSEQDGQPCMDHDRQSGEGVNPQEYVGIKIDVIEFAPEAKELITSTLSLDGKKVYLVAGTLRPETMYGQTCCFVSPKITYGLFDAGNNEYFICTKRAFKNMCFQDLTPKTGFYEPVLDVPGSTLVGSRISPPLSVYPEVRVLPMETILENKGTGVVTCVPSDSPDDYITSLDLQNKPEYYKIQKEWAEYAPVPIIKTPSYGDLTAKKLVEDLKIRSPKDKELLAKAKELAYKEGFYQGIMVIGKYEGLKVEEAKPKVRADLISEKKAFVYSEPEAQVISRSGDVCVVALEDQWYTDYGEENWKKLAEKLLGEINTFTAETRHGLEKTLDWLKNWALSRTYGLGTKIPWDQQYLVESLSDSTIYPTFYTVCHLLHSDYYGKDVGPLGVAAEEMNDAAWNYVYCLSDEPGNCKIPVEKLNKMRREFQYFYPIDSMISGKDLINNHLTFFIYIHAAIFPERFWPKGIRANGHLMLNNEKMSKSTGNFLTLSQLIEKFGADASRVTLADGGDGNEDANFDESSANAAILRLYNLKEWMEESVKNIDSFRSGPSDKNFFDVAFNNEMNMLIEETRKSYTATFYKSALKTGLFDFQAARDYYREATSDVGMHRDLVLRYIETQVLLLTPIAPHFAEYIWLEVLKNKATVQNARFPTATAPEDRSTTAALTYVRDISRSIRETEGAALKKKKGKAAGPEFNPKNPAKLTLYVTLSFPEWQDRYIDLVREEFEKTSLDFSPDFRQKVAKVGDVKRGMQFVNHLKSRLTSSGESPETVFNRKLVFDEVSILKDIIPVLQKAPPTSNVESVQIVVLDGPDATKGKDAVTEQEVEVPNSKVVQSALPGQPGIILANAA